MGGYTTQHTLPTTFFTLVDRKKAAVDVIFAQTLLEAPYTSKYEPELKLPKISRVWVLESLHPGDIYVQGPESWTISQVAADLDWSHSPSIIKIAHKK